MPTFQEQYEKIRMQEEAGEVLHMLMSLLDSAFLQRDGTPHPPRAVTMRTDGRVVGQGSVRYARDLLAGVLQSTLEERQRLEQQEMIACPTVEPEVQ